MRMHRFLTGREAGGIKPIYGLTSCVSPLPPLYYCTSPPYLSMPSSVRYSFAPQLSRTAVRRTFLCRRVENQRSTSVWLGTCVTPERDSKKLCGGSASMLSVPHAFGTSGKAGRGGRVNSDSGCRLDCEIGRETNFLSLG